MFKKTLFTFLTLLLLTPLFAFAADYQAESPTENDLTVNLETTMGTIKIKLFPDEAPKTVENFQKHIQDGYYNDLLFHRVIENFMIQTGDPKGDGTGGESIWGEPFKDEFSDKLSNVRGAVSMANSGANTNGSQFFICQQDSLALDGVHTVFGQVYEGIEVVDKIASVDTDDSDKPLKDIKIENMTTSGETQSWFDKYWVTVLWIVGIIVFGYFAISIFIKMRNSKMTRAERRRR